MINSKRSDTEKNYLIKEGKKKQVLMKSLNVTRLLITV